MNWRKAFVATEADRRFVADEGPGTPDDPSSSQELESPSTSHDYSRESVPDALPPALAESAQAAELLCNSDNATDGKVICV